MRALVALGLALTLASCKPHGAEKSIPAVRVIRTDQNALSTSTRYSATVEPQTRVDLAFKVGGYIAKIATRRGSRGAPRLLQAGDAVEKGEVLAQLKAADFENLRLGAKAALSEANAAYRKAALDYGRARRLRAGEDIARADLDATRVALDAAKARVEGAKAKLAQSSSAVEDSALRSPLAGTVTRRAVEVGSLVAPGAVGFSIEATSTVKAVFGVADAILPRLKLGSRHAVATDVIRDRTFLGTLSRISPTADPKTHLFEAEVTIPNAEGDLKPGMIVTLILDMANLPSAKPPVMVPLAAVVRAPGQAGAYAVFVVGDKDGQTVAEARTVELGDFMGNDIPVLSGLTGTERVVVSGASLLFDGAPVRVIP